METQEYKNRKKFDYPEILILTFFNKIFFCFCFSYSLISEIKTLRLKIIHIGFDIKMKSNFFKKL